MRVAASITLAVLAASGLSACQFITPQATTRSYTHSDGVNGQAGDVAIRNVFLVTEDGETASLIGVLSTRSEQPQSVTLEYDSAAGLQSIDVEVPAQGLVSLRTDALPAAADAGAPVQRQVVLEDVDAPLGALFSVNFAVGDDDATLRLPVLDNLLPGYETLLPTATPTPTRTRRGSSESPSPSPTPSDETLPTPTDGVEE